MCLQRLENARKILWQVEVRRRRLPVNRAAEADHEKYYNCYSTMISHDVSLQLGRPAYYSNALVYYDIALIDTTVAGSNLLRVIHSSSVSTP